MTTAPPCAVVTITNLPILGEESSYQEIHAAIKELPGGSCKACTQGGSFSLCWAQ